jgi:hypothetical protein
VNETNQSLSFGKNPCILLLVSDVIAGSSIVEQLHQLILLAGCLIHGALYDSLSIAGQPSAFDGPGDHFVRQLFPGCDDKIVRFQLHCLHQVGDWLWSEVAFFVVCHVRNLSDRQP